MVLNFTKELYKNRQLTAFTNQRPEWLIKEAEAVREAKMRFVENAQRTGLIDDATHYTRILGYFDADLRELEAA